MELDERIELFEVRFDELPNMYAESDDGYVRQSLVRVAERPVPGIAIVFAISDDDGRVRQSAKRGLKDVFRTYDALEDGETIQALALELEAMATEHSGKQRKHLLDVKEDAEFFMQSGFARIIEGFQEEFGDSP